MKTDEVMRDEEGMTTKMARECLTSGSKVEGELSYQYGKEKRVIRSVISQLKDLNNDVIGVMGVGIDISEQKQAEAALRNSRAILSSFMESATEGFVLWDKNLNLMDINPTALKILAIGSSKETLTGMNMLEMAPNLKETGRYDRYKTVVETGEPFYVEDAVIDPVFGNKHVAINAFKVAGGLGMVFSDVTEKKRSEKKIRTSLKEKEVLLREIHHRVKNNMQVAISLLKLQSDYVEDKTLSHVFLEIRNRMKSMALVHERLYQSEDLANINFKRYVNDLLKTLFAAYGVNTNRISSNVNMEDVLFEVDFATPCGLIVTELVSNALKHAFPADTDGEIIISLSAVDDEFELIVSDDGTGLSEEIDFETPNSFGLNLVKLLVEGQLEGELEIDRSKGTKYHIRFKKPVYSDSVEV